MVNCEKQMLTEQISTLILNFYLKVEFENWISNCIVYLMRTTQKTFIVWAQAARAS